MKLTADDIAGVVDLFGGLTRSELGAGLAELAFKRGEEHDPDAFEGDIDAALRSYHLVAVDPDEAGVDSEQSLLIVGPVAFPELPQGATDLPHILDVEERTVDRTVAARAAKQRFHDDVDAAVAAENGDRIETLLDASYELEAWGSIALKESRERLDTARVG